MSENQRLNFLIAELIKLGQIKNDSDLCKKLNYPSGNFAKIKSGERKVPASLKLALFNKFGIEWDKVSKDSEIVKSVEKPPQNEIQEPKVQYMPSDDVWSQAISAITEAMKIIGKNNDVLRRLVELGLDKDAYTFDAKKAGVTRQDLP